MNLPNSAILALGGIFYRIYRQTDDATKDAMAILKIFDFSWNQKTGILTYEKGGESVRLTKEMCLRTSPFEVVPVKNISNFDLDCLEKVLNTRSMVGLKSAEGLYPLFECIGWKISHDGDTYRLHYLGGTDYWEGNLWNEPWDDEGFPDWYKNQKIPDRWDEVN